MEFTAHNILLDNKTRTINNNDLLAEGSQCQSYIRLLNWLYKDCDKSKIRIVDLGCLEGGYTVEFARNGFQAVGIEAREQNIERCNYVAENLSLPNLSFHCDDVRNLDKYGEFDVIFCSGLLYHLDKPVEFIQQMGKLTKKILLLETHYAEEKDYRYDSKNTGVRSKLAKKISPETVQKADETKHNFHLSPVVENEGKRGRWFYEFSPDLSKDKMEAALWASYENPKSFWILKKDLLQTIKDSGFDMVFEGYDHLGNIAENNYIKYLDRNLFIGIKTK